MALIGGLSVNGAVPKKTSIIGATGGSNTIVPIVSKPQTLQAQPKTSGVINLGQGSATDNSIKLGSNPGMIKSKTDVTGNTVNYDTKPNPSVLEQQKALNKQGAGLVEDGIIGDKTRAAIAKYGNSSSPQPDYDAKTGLLTSSGKTKGLPEVNAPKSTPTPTPPPGPASAPTISYTPRDQAQNVSRAGAQSQNEFDTQQRLIELSKNPSQAYTDATKAYQDAVQRLQEFKNSEAQTKQDIFSDPVSAGVMQGRNQAVQQANAEKLAALQGAVNEAQAAMGFANTQQGLQAQAGQSAYSGAQAQAGRGLTAQTDVFGASLPVQVPYGTAYRNPLTGEDVTGGSGGSGLLKGGAAGLIPQYYDEYNQAQTTLDAITKNEQLFSNLLGTANVNPTDLTPINELLQRVGQLTSSADYANFQNLISSLRANYTQLLASRGMTPSEAGEKANSLLPENASIATINSVLQTLKQEGQNYLSSKADQLKRAEETFKTGTAPNTSTPSTSSGGSIWDF